MATGFTQRFKGKIQAAQLWLGNSPMNGPGSVQALSTTSATAIITNYGVTTIVASSVLAIFRLAAPVPGIEKTIQFTQVSSAVMVSVSTDQTVSVNGSSINNTFKSTVASVVNLVGTSTANWAINGIFPGSTLVSSILTLSTST